MESGDVFWDIVVLTAADELQKAVFEKQINLKLKENELPTSLYFVVCDPPGYKIGILDYVWLENQVSIPVFYRPMFNG